MYTLKDFYSDISILSNFGRSKLGLLLLEVFGIGILMILKSYGIIPKITFSVFIVLVLIFFIFWVIVSGRIILPSRKIIVGIALRNNDSDSRKIISETFNLISDKLKSSQIIERFKFVYIDPSVFSSIYKAEKFLKKNKMGLIIHGTVYNGFENDKYRYDLKNFFFTYNIAHDPRNKEIINFITDDINIMITSRNWIIEESNTIIDREKISNNLVEIMLSVIAIGTCFSAKHIETSIVLMETVLPMLDKSVQKKKDKIKISSKEKLITVPINMLRSGRLRSILNSCYVNTSRMYMNDGRNEEAIDILLKGLKTGADKIACYSGLALSYFYIGDLKKSEENTKKLYLTKKNHPIYFLNMAFYSIKRKDYNTALDYYEKLRGHYKNKFQHLIDQSITFLIDRKKEEPIELCYDFAIGVLKYNYKNKTEGRALLNQFITDAEKMTEYDILIKKTRFILKIKTN